MKFLQVKYNLLYSYLLFYINKIFYYGVKIDVFIMSLTISKMIF